VNPDLQALVNAIDRLTAAQQKGSFDYINLAVLVMTLGAVVYYTRETVKIRKAAYRQNETSMIPVISIRVHPPQAHFDKNQSEEHPHLVLCNEGNGPAFNVTLDNFSANGKELQFDYGSNVIRPTEERELTFHLQEGNSGTIGNVSGLYHWINTEVLPDPVRLAVHCVSVSSTAYTFHFAFTPRAGRLVILMERVESPLFDVAKLD
jgi:hypothetical protein